LVKNTSFLLFTSFIDVEYFDYLSSTVLLASYGAIEISVLLLFGRINDNIENFFVAFVDDVLWNLHTFVLFHKVLEYDLNFGDYGDETFLVIKNDSVGDVEHGVVDFELVEIVTVFNV
jgi:hypothetical protein